MGIDPKAALSYNLAVIGLSPLGLRTKRARISSSFPEKRALQKRPPGWGFVCEDGAHVGSGSCALISGVALPVVSLTPDVATHNAFVPRLASRLEPRAKPLHIARRMA
eukprot:scaffold10988_cov62-Phaeocystis_antarctica.AAC.3